VPGTSSEPPPRRTRTRRAGPATSRSVPDPVRVTNVYATPWHLADGTTSELPGYLPLSRFEQYYRRSADQLPAALHRDTLDPAPLRFQRWQHAAQLTAAEMWVVLPDGRLQCWFNQAAQLHGVSVEYIDEADRRKLDDFMDHGLSDAGFDF
jgi:hypothetical protein